MVAQTKFDVASAALIMVGANAVTTFNDSSSTESIACFQLYDATVNSLFELYPWRFATKTTQLSRLGTAPNTIWSAAYNAPSDARRIQRLAINTLGNDIPFDRYEDEIHCDAGASEVVWCVHTYAPAPSQWPYYFTELCHFALARKFAITLPAKLDMAEVMQNQFDYQMRMAKHADSQQQTSRKFKTRGRGSIMEARLE